MWEGTLLKDGDHKCNCHKHSHDRPSDKVDDPDDCVDDGVFITLCGWVQEIRIVFTRENKDEGSEEGLEDVTEAIRCVH